MTQLEDLSNDVFLEIFDYLNACDIIFAFTELNVRITGILNLIRLHINIDHMSYRYKLEYLSMYLKRYSNQVISLDVYDEIFDQKNVISYLFERHDFVNLHACTFHSVNSSMEFDRVFKKLSTLTKIKSFRIIQFNDNIQAKLNRSDTEKISQWILLHTPSTLRSADLYLSCHHAQIRTARITTTYLTHLKLIFHDTLINISIYSLLPLLRIHCALLNLCVTIKSTEKPMIGLINVPDLPHINEADFPVSSSLKSFDLQIVMVSCDLISIGQILSCMPNLHRFVITFIADNNFVPYIILRDLINGQSWREMLINRVSNLKKFDFYLSFLSLGQYIDLDSILKSFRCLMDLYDSWNVSICRSRTSPLTQFEHIRLWTQNYNPLKTYREKDLATFTMSDTFDMRSTTLSNFNHFHYYTQDIPMHFYMERKTPTRVLQLPIIPFPYANSIVCHLALPLPSISSFLTNTSIRFKQISLWLNKNDDAQNYIYNLSRLFNLFNINSLQFSRNNGITRLDVIEQVLLACPNIKSLVIDSPLLFSSKVFDNLALMSTFKRIEKILIAADKMYFPVKYASTFVQRFPSLILVKIEVYSIDTSLPIVNILLSEHAKLRLIIIQFKHNYNSQHLFTRDYVIEKRRQSFGLSQHDDYKVFVKIHGQKLYIRI